MTVMRTPGRRYWTDHWHIRATGFMAIFGLILSSWFTVTKVHDLEKPNNPHFRVDRCYECHERRGSKMKSDDCFKCHDLLTRTLLPNAVEDRKRISEKPCFHPIKIVDPGEQRTVTQLCIGCHKSPTGYVAMMNVVAEKYIEIDMGATHPIGLMPTELVFPKTLPLGESGEINCITCHDQHAQDRRLRLLRYYYPGNGHPADFRPLCNDCHEEGWLPLKLKRNMVLRDGHEH